MQTVTGENTGEKTIDLRKGKIPMQIRVTREVWDWLESEASWRGMSRAAAASFILSTAAHNDTGHK